MSTLGMSAIFFVLTIVGGIIMDCGAFYTGISSTERYINVCYVIFYSK